MSLSAKQNISIQSIQVSIGRDTNIDAKILISNWEGPAQQVNSASHSSSQRVVGNTDTNTITTIDTNTKNTNTNKEGPVHQADSASQLSSQRVAGKTPA